VAAYPHHACSAVVRPCAKGASTPTNRRRAHSHEQKDRTPVCSRSLRALERPTLTTHAAPWSDHVRRVPPLPPTAVALTPTNKKRVARLYAVAHSLRALEGGAGGEQINPMPQQTRTHGAAATTAAGADASRGTGPLPLPLRTSSAFNSSASGVEASAGGAGAAN